MFDLDFVIFNNIFLSELLLCVSVLAFLVGMVYLFSFLKVTYHRNVKVKNEDYEPVSVVLVVVDEIDYLKESFEMVLNQDFPCDYEVVIVNYKPEVSETVEYLDSLKDKYRDRLYVTTIRREGTLHNAKRLAYTLGIKAAKYNNVIFSDPRVEINSKLWLKSVSRGFKPGNSVAVGYVDVKYKKGLRNKIFRTVNTYDSLMWLSAAKNSNLFRANIMNFGLKASLFFKVGGYRERLRLNTGESDIFVQKLVQSKAKAGLVLAKTATTSKNLDDYGLVRWYKNQIFDFYTTKFYKFKDSVYLTLEPLFSALFWLGIVATAVFDYHLWYYLLIMIVLRWLVLCFSLYRFSTLTGSKIPYFMHLLYDVWGAYYKLLLFLGRKFNPSFDLWIRITA